MKEEIQARASQLAVRAVGAWGRDAQVIKCCEEMAELTQVLCKVVNGSPLTEAAIVDEIADALFMVMQMRTIWGTYKIEERLTYKMNRLEEALDRDFQEKQDAAIARSI